jgi:hypothetical protein
MSQCKAVLRIGQTQYYCEMESPHPGLAHANEEVDALWISDGEARRYKPTRETEERKN